MRNNILPSTTLRRLKAEIPHGDSLLGDNRKLRPMVTISFDDGYDSDYNIVFPIFQELGIRGTFFAIGNSGFSEQPGRTTAEQYKEMNQLGQEIGCHSASHIPFFLEDSSVIYEDLADSIQTLENEIGTKILTHAYPYGGGDILSGQATNEDARRLHVVASGLYEAARGTSKFTTTYPYGGKDVNHIFYRETYLTPYGAPDTFNIPCHLADGTSNWVYLMIDYLLELEEPAWYNLAFHRVYPDGAPDKPDDRLFRADFLSAIQYIADKRDQGLLDIVPFYEGARRIKGGNSKML